MAGREHEVALYGATGYTGRLIARELADRGTSFAIAGRSKGKLEALSEELGGAPEVVVADITDGAALQGLASRADVVASAAGPFKDLGPPVLEACLETGTHLVDITGEQGWIRQAYEHDQRARDAGLTVVNALGFDVVPSDVAAVAACRGLDEVSRLDLMISTTAGMSAGTRRTMAATTGDWWYYEDGRFVPAPAGRFLRTCTFPGVGERTCVFVPWGDVATAPRSTDARVVRTFFRTSRKTARGMHLTWPLTRLVSKLPWVDKVLGRGVPGPGHGPSPQEREQALFTIVGEAAGPDGTTQRAAVKGRDPYGLTGATCAIGALAIARGQAPRTGVLTPTQLLEPERWVKELTDFDVEIQEI